ncbi:hypothetical protein CN449_15320 [Bacillus thuringiensis]|uniref:hypothetical protein n=1 Tax=Bacillus thuringiensis TaxID=1428 RepID=UPI000BF57E31|nr:hypothetical protein [Bacillus thuringiensis]PEW74033.1 hypothetical protein CN449_15320 [Bacillus thuringiensis]PFD32530.1 hypothetical protein CN269_04275 [Bacillus thuringiensis]
MRHTRNLQCMKVCKDKKLAKLMFKGQKNYPIKHMTEEFRLGKEIDPTFKWHRDFEGWGENWVEFGGDEFAYGDLIKVNGNNLHLDKGWSRLPK